MTGFAMLLGSSSVAVQYVGTFCATSGVSTLFPLTVNPKQKLTKSLDLRKRSRWNRLEQ